MTTKKRKPFMRWQSRRGGEDRLAPSSQVALIETIIESDADDNVEFSADTSDISTPSPTSCISLMLEETTAPIVSPERNLRDPDDYSVYIVHKYIEGEITNSVEDSRSGMSTRTSSAGRLTDISPDQCACLYGEEQVADYIPREVRSYTSYTSNKDKINNSLLDDDISAISFEKMLTSKDIKNDEFVEDASVTTRDVGNGCVVAKQRMIENILAVKFAHDARGREMKLREDESTYVTLDVDEWEQEFGNGCCFTKQLHGIVMDTGKAVYDWAGAPEDYALGKHIVTICDDGTRKHY
jgi:hypothetical protein